MKKIIIALLVVSLGIGSYLLFQHKQRVKSTTRISVIEGVVKVCQLDSNNRASVERSVSAGETITTYISVPKLTKKPLGFSVLNKIVPALVFQAQNFLVYKSSNFFKGDTERIVVDHDVTSFLTGAFANVDYIRDPWVVLTEGGFTGSATLDSGSGFQPIQSSGFFYIDRGPNFEHRLRIRLNKLQIGSISLPQFIIRNIEYMFDTAVNDPDKPMPFIIKSIEYYENGFLLQYK
ncbi:MAG: hypothetical protein ACI9CF_000157 [Candidatus Omnitrophota bacterium]